MKCAKCGKYLSGMSESCDCEESGLIPQDAEMAKTVNEKVVLQVKNTLGAIMIFKDLDDLKEAIINGSVCKTMLTRIVNESDRDNGGNIDGAAWQTVEEIAKGRPDLEVLYRPIWATVKRYVTYGIIAGIALKALDTTLAFFLASPAIGILWLISVASLFAKRWWVPMVVAFFLVKAGIAVMMFFGAAVAVALIGAAFGAPLGMIVGTLVGYQKARNLALACDAVAEGNRPWIYGLAVPSIALVALGWFYFAWLTPRILEWMA